MKKIFTLIAAALMTMEINAQTDFGIYLNQNGTSFSGDVATGAYLTTTSGGVVVTPAKGDAAKTVYDVVLATGDNTFTKDFRYRGEVATGDMEVVFVTGATDDEASATFGGEGVLTDLPTNCPQIWGGFTITIPEGKQLVVEKIYAEVAAGNSIYWNVNIDDAAGNSKYASGQLRYQGYNNAQWYYGNDVEITTSEVTNPNFGEGWAGNLTSTNGSTGAALLSENTILTGENTVKIFYGCTNSRGVILPKVTISGTLEDVGAAEAQSGFGIYLNQSGTSFSGDAATGAYLTTTSDGVVVIPAKGDAAKTVYDVVLATGDNTFTKDFRYRGEVATGDMEVVFVTGATDDEASATFGGEGVLTDLPTNCPQIWGGFTITIPEGKQLVVEKIYAEVAAGNSIYWNVNIDDAAGNSKYASGQLRYQGYNNAQWYYGNDVEITTSEVTNPNFGEGWAGNLTSTNGSTGAALLSENTILTGENTVKIFYGCTNSRGVILPKVTISGTLENATGISSAVNNAVESNVMYNLAGQRIAAPVSGQIYILNGKKYIAK